MKNGWVKIHRNIMESNVWPKDKFSLFEFWIYLLLEANYKTHDFEMEGVIIHVNPGEIITSIERLCRETGRSKTWILKRLQFLIDCRLIIHNKKDRRFTNLRLCNYEGYNSDGKDEVLSKMLSESHSKMLSEMPHTRKIKKEEKEKKYIYSDFASQIEEIIEYYQTTIKPLKKISPNRTAMLCDRLKTFSVDDCKKAIDNVNASPFHSGQNEEGKIYKEFDMIFKTDEQLEKYLNLTSGKETKKNVRTNRYLDSLPSRADLEKSKGRG